ncbi:MAG: hypothetical protein ACREEM_30490 [Blastocatellia bacterium]
MGRMATATPRSITSNVLALIDRLAFVRCVIGGDVVYDPGGKRRNERAVAAEVDGPVGQRAVWVVINCAADSGETGQISSMRPRDPRKPIVSRNKM